MPLRLAGQLDQQVNGLAPPSSGSLETLVGVKHGSDEVESTFGGLCEVIGPLLWQLHVVGGLGAGGGNGGGGGPGGRGGSGGGDGGGASGEMMQQWKPSHPFKPAPHCQVP